MNDYLDWPSIMQWSSPDNVIPDLYQPNDWNRYLYARANPLKYTDPTGHFSEEEIETHLKNAYRELWNKYFAAWKSDKLFWDMLLAAQYGDNLFAPESGLGYGTFERDGGTFFFSSNHSLYEYQGNGPYRLSYTTDHGFVYRPLQFEGYYSGKDEYSGFVGNGMPEGAIQPRFDYSSGVPFYSGYYQYIYFNSTTSSNWASGSGVPYLLSQVVKYAARSLGTKWAGPISIGIDAGTLAWYINNGPLRQKIILTVTQVDMTIEYLDGMLLFHEENGIKKTYE